MTGWRGSIAIALSLSAAGCVDSALDDDTSAVVDDINEDACGTAIEDVTFSDQNPRDFSTLWNVAYSPNGNYGTGGTHPGCPNQYIVDEFIDTPVANHAVFEAAYEGPWNLNAYGGCSAAWTTATLWRWKSDGRYHRVTSKMTYGSSEGGSCVARVSISVQDSATGSTVGSFRLVVASGVIYTYMPVQVIFDETH